MEATNKLTQSLIDLVFRILLQRDYAQTISVESILCLAGIILLLQYLLYLIILLRQIFGLQSVFQQIILFYVTNKSYCSEHITHQYFAVMIHLKMYGLLPYSICVDLRYFCSC